MKKLLTILLFTFFAVFNTCYADDYDHNFHPMQVTDSDVQSFVEKFNLEVPDEFILKLPPNYSPESNTAIYMSQNNKFVILFDINDNNCVQNIACSITKFCDTSNDADCEQYISFNDAILTTIGLTKLELQRIHLDGNKVAFTWCNKINRLVIRSFSEERDSGPLFFYSASENEPLFE